MKTFNVYEAKTQLSKLLDMVASGEHIVIARSGKPIADLTPHQSKPKIKFGVATGKIHYTDKDFEGTDPEIQEMFYGKDWNKSA